MRHKDARARLTSCILRNMRTVKCHGWEGAFLDRVLRVRGRELGALRTSGLLFSVSLVSFQVSTFLVTSPWPPCRAWTWFGGGEICKGWDEVGRAPGSWSLSLQTTPSIKTHPSWALLSLRDPRFLLSWLIGQVTPLNMVVARIRSSAPGSWNCCAHCRGEVAVGAGSCRGGTPGSPYCSPSLGTSACPVSL